MVKQFYQLGIDIKRFCMTVPTNEPAILELDRCVFVLKIDFLSFTGDSVVEL